MSSAATVPLTASPCRPSEPQPAPVMGHQTCRSARSAVMSNSATAAASSHRLQFLPQPALPEVPRVGACSMAGRRQSELLPVPYFHVVFTVPAPIAEIALHNKAVVYGILFTAAAETLPSSRRSPASRRRDRVGRRAAHLGTEPASSSPSPLRRAGWRAIVDRTAGSPAALASFCRSSVVASLPPAFPDPPPGGVRCGQLRFLAIWRAWPAPAAFAAWLRPLRAIRWVVYAKRPFGGSRAGARISRPLYSSRRHRQQPSRRSYRRPVSFRWKDYRHHDKQKVMTLGATSSSAASCSTSCLTASIASATTAISPTAACRQARPLPPFAGGPRASDRLPLLPITASVISSSPAVHSTSARLRRPHDRNRRHPACEYFRRCRSLEHLMIPMRDPIRAQCPWIGASCRRRHYRCRVSSDRRQIVSRQSSPKPRDLRRHSISLPPDRRHQHPDRRLTGCVAIQTGTRCSAPTSGRAQSP